MLVSLVLLLSGCKSDCEEVCEENLACGYDFPVLPNADCDETCDLAEDYAEVKECLREFDAYYACLVAGHKDDCVFIDPCDAEFAAYAACNAR
jgi:hypothetical protein